VIDRTAAEWPGTKRWLEGEITTCLERLASPDCRAMAEADQLRGKIAAYRHIIATVEPPPPPVLTETPVVPGQSY
jgi:hypothetical protein